MLLRAPRAHDEDATLPRRAGSTASASEVTSASPPPVPLRANKTPALLASLRTTTDTTALHYTPSPQHSRPCAHSHGRTCAPPAARRYTRAHRPPPSHQTRSQAHAPRFATSARSALANACSACLLAEYEDRNGRASSPCQRCRLMLARRPRLLSAEQIDRPARTWHACALYTWMEEIYTRLPLRCSIAGSTAFVSATCRGPSLGVGVGVHTAHAQRMTDLRLRCACVGCGSGARGTGPM